MNDNDSIKGKKPGQKTFIDRNLEGAIFSDTKGLTPEQFSGSNLRNCVFPAGFAFYQLDNLKELSKNAGAMYLATTLACIFVLLTAYSVRDMQLLIDSGHATLPFLGLSVPTVSFLFFAPLTLVALSVGLQLYLQRLWLMVASLPAVFPDGLSVRTKIYPWIVTDLVRLGFRKEFFDRDPVSLVQVLAIVITTYGTVPATLALLSWRCLPRHDVGLTTMHGFCLTVAVAWAIISFDLAWLTLNRNYPHMKYRDEPVRTPQQKRWLCAALLLTTLGTPGLAFFAVSCFSSPPRLLPENQGVDNTRANWNLLAVAPSIVEDQSLRPTNWEEPADLFIDPQADPKPKEDHDSRASRMRAALLRLRASVPRGTFGRQGGSANLRYLQARGAFLENADFRSADLTCADFSDCDLRGAEWGHRSGRSANLSGTAFRDANLTVADLRGSSLRNADLRGAIMVGADLSACDLTGAKLQGTDLRHALLAGTAKTGAMKLGAELEHAKISGAKLTFVDLSGAKLPKDMTQVQAIDCVWGKGGFEFLNFSRSELQGIELPKRQMEGCSFAGAKLKEANFRGATLTKVDFTGADLAQADFTGAVLTDVTFENADLTRARFDKAKVNDVCFDGARLFGAVSIPKPADELDGTSFNKARFDIDTTWSAGTWPRRWASFSKGYSSSGTRHLGEGRYEKKTLNASEPGLTEFYRLDKLPFTN